MFCVLCVCSACVYRDVYTCVLRLFRFYFYGTLETGYTYNQPIDAFIAMVRVKNLQLVFLFRFPVTQFFLCYRHRQAN